MPELATLSKEDRLTLVKSCWPSGWRRWVSILSFFLLTVVGAASLLPIAETYGGTPLVLVAAMLVGLPPGWFAIILACNLMRPKMREVLKSCDHTA